MIDGCFDVVGAAGPLRYFEAIDPSRLAHGYLFSGPGGVGKKTFVLRLAQSLLCETPKSTLLGYCGHCRSCVRVASSTHPDLIVHVGALKIGERGGGAGFGEEEATARSLVRALSMHSYAGGRRIFVLGDADLTREAANALLKFFEEPPAGVVLILTTAAPGRLLPTIRSRLIELVFPLLSAAEIARVLQGDGIAESEARRVAPLAQGSVERAQALLAGAEEGLRESVIAWYLDAASSNSPDASWATRATLDEGLEIVKTLTRDRLALSVAGDSAPLLAPDVRERLDALPAAPERVLLRALTAVSDAQRMAATNVTPELVAGTVRLALGTLR